VKVAAGDTWREGVGEEYMGLRELLMEVLKEGMKRLF
jgi:hypothetical protein